MNDIRQRLIDLLEQADGQANNDIPSLEMIADYLIKNGVVPVVKCKDCKYLSKNKFYCKYFNIAIIDNGFCYRGARMDGMDGETNEHKSKV